MGKAYFLIYLFTISLFNYQFAFADPVHRLIPFTDSKYVRPCSTEINEKELFKQATSCGKTVIEDLDKKAIEIPQCYIIGTDSPDVHKGKKINFISIFPIGAIAVLGFYEDETKTIYLVENQDLEGVYIHELGHLFIDKVYGNIYHNGDPGHEHEYWTTCTTPQYESN